MRKRNDSVLTIESGRNGGTHVVLVTFLRLTTGSRKWHSFLSRAHLSQTRAPDCRTHLAFAFEHVVHDRNDDFDSIGCLASKSGTMIDARAGCWAKASMGASNPAIILGEGSFDHNGMLWSIAALEGAVLP